MAFWDLKITPKRSGVDNMRTDLKLFNDFERGIIPSTLRIYSWKPKCISLGYSQRLDRLIDGKMAGELGWDVVKRPTGGGIVFHNEAEVTYSLVTAIDDPMLPDGLVPSYKRISEAVINGLSLLGVGAEIRKQKADSRTLNTGLCFSYPAEYEIVVGDKKIVGSAQKRGKRTLLQQGSIFVRNMGNGDYSVLKDAYEKESSVSVEDILGREVGFEELSRALVKGFEEGLQIKFKIQK